MTSADASLGDAGRRFEGNAEHNGVSVGDAAVYAAGVVGHRRLRPLVAAAAVVLAAFLSAVAALVFLTFLSAMATAMMLFALFSAMAAVMFLSFLAAMTAMVFLSLLTVAALVLREEVNML